MKVKHHMAVNIQGLLNAYKGKKINILQDDDGNALSDQKARIELHNLQVLGHKYMPSGNCEGFDPFEHGCPGHPICDFCGNQIIGNPIKVISLGIEQVQCGKCEIE